MLQISFLLPTSTKGALRRFRPSYALASLVLVGQMLFGFVGTASAVYPGANGDILAAHQNEVVAYDPTNYDATVLRTLDSGNFVLGVSSDKTGKLVAYTVDLADNVTGQLRIYNRETGTDQLVKTFDNASADVPDENGDYFPTQDISAISPDGNYIALQAFNTDGSVNLLIVRLSDGTTVARYANGREGVGWSADSTKVFATSTESGNSGFAWFNVDGSGRSVVVPTSALPVADQVTASSMSPDGQHVLYSATGFSGSSPTTSIGEIGVNATGDRLLVSNTATDFPLSSTYSPDGQDFAYLNFSAAGVQYLTRSLASGSTPIATSPVGQDMTRIDWAPIPAPSDTTPPVVTGTPDRAANANGWYNANVSIDWHSVDPSPSSGTPTDPANTIASTQGKDVNYVSGQSCDPAGNCATGSIKLSIDKTAPTGAFGSGVLVIRLLGGNITGSAGDGLSGVSQVKITQGGNMWSSNTGGGLTLSCNVAKTSCTWLITNSLSLPLGVNSYTITVTDLAGNTTTSSKTYTVI